MKVKLLIPALALATQLHASVIDLGPDRSSFDERFAFDGLNGTSAHHVSLDLMFSTSVHVNEHTYTDFAIGLNIQTAVLGVFATGTGTILDINGNPMISPRVLGSARDDTGSLFNGLFPLYADLTGTMATDITRPFDFYGVHFELDGPDSLILDGKFSITASEFNNSNPFRIGPHVPDSGTTVALFLLSLLGIVLYDKKTTS